MVRLIRKELLTELTKTECEQYGIFGTKIDLNTVVRSLQKLIVIEF